MKTISASTVNSKAEELFVELFCDAFGPDKANNLYIQYPFVDIYGNHRYIDFALENQDMKIAVEVDGETYHNPKMVSDNKYNDDLLKQNSMIFNDWKVYRWTYKQLLKQPDKVKDELVTFLGDRQDRGLLAEKPSSLYQKGGYTEKDVERNILTNPFKRFADMRFLLRCKDISLIEINPVIFKKLTEEDKAKIIRVCDEKLEGYYSKL